MRATAFLTACIAYVSHGRYVRPSFPKLHDHESVAGSSSQIAFADGSESARKQWKALAGVFLRLDPEIAFAYMPSHLKANTRLGRHQLASMSDDSASTFATLKRAADQKDVDPDEVVDSLLDLEKGLRAQAREDDGALSRKTLAALDGCWRLVFTTGTIDSQKKLGRKINYFPIKAVQSFRTADMTLTNGIYLGDFAVVKFFGPFTWDEAKRKLEFDFDAIAVFGARFDLPKGGAAKIGSSTGLGSENNEELIKKDKRPFFNWISADEDIATARGGGGGIALWRRDREMEAMGDK